MGCWNGTCEISKLPILAGDEMVTIMLISTGAKPEGITFYSHDKFVPFGYPVIGKYNNYGSTEEVENEDVNMKFLQKQKIYKAKRTDENTIEYEKYEVSDFSTFISDLMTDDEPLYVKHKNYYGEYKELNYITIHKKLYEDLISEIIQRKTCINDEKTYGEKIIEKIQKAFADKKERLLKDKEMEKFFSKISPISTELGFIDSINPHMTYDYIIDELFEKWDEENLNYLLNIIALDTALSFMRSGYLVTTGLGSQCMEMYLQRIVAQFIFSYTDNYKKEYLDENIVDEDFDESEILKENIYIY